MDISNLVVVDIKTDKASPDWPGKERMFCGESCAYQLLVGDLIDAEAIPPEIKDLDATKILFGANAYAYLLANATGLDDKNPGETRIIGDMKRSWERYCKDCEGTDRHEDIERLRDVVEAVFRDSKTIRNELLSKMRPYSSDIGVTARSMAGITTKDTVLLVTEKEGATGTMLKILGNNAGNIILTDVDPARLETHMSEAQRMVKYKKIEAGITKVSSKDGGALQEAFERATHVMILQPMGVNPDFDNALMTAWRDRVREDGKMIHLKGDPLARGKTTDAWDMHRPQNFIDLEGLMAQREADGRFNDGIIAEARNASYNCATAISTGREPVKRFLHLPPDEYSSRFATKQFAPVEIPEPLKVEQLVVPIRHDKLDLIPGPNLQKPQPRWEAMHGGLTYDITRHFVRIEPIPNILITTPERDGVKAITYLATDLEKRSEIFGANSFFLEGNLPKASLATMEEGTLFSAYTMEPGSMVNGGEVIIIGNQELAKKSRNFTKPNNTDATIIYVPETQRGGVFLLMSGQVKPEELSPDTPELKLKPDASNLKDILGWLKDNNLLLSVQPGQKHAAQIEGIQGLLQADKGVV